MSKASFSFLKDANGQVVAMTRDDYRIRSMHTLFVTIRNYLAAIKDFLLGVSPWIPGEGKHGVMSLSTQELRDAGFCLFHDAFGHHGRSS